MILNLLNKASIIQEGLQNPPSNPVAVNINKSGDFLENGVQPHLTPQYPNNGFLGN